jgi:hypothetical protein
MMDGDTNEFKVHLEERKLLIDAARESARSFDQAVLAFGSAAFGFSVAFLKDVVSVPAPQTLKWLALSWGAFSVGLLAILLSFLFSHRACLFEIHVGEESLGKPVYKRKKNRWSAATNWCNGLSITFLFIGVLCWSIFAFDNLSVGGVPMNKRSVDQSQNDSGKAGYVPPSAPVKAPQQQTPANAPATPPPQPDPKK